ncbi:hypothetical protein [Pedobacter rhizosphaerae]|nr:hypothetical protein [Pedobacter rhizosphaerae]
MKLNAKISSVILFFILLAVKNVNAQYQFIPDEKGKLITDKRYENIEGSAYLYADWKLGEVITNENKLIQNLSLKYDQVTDNLLFQANGASYEFKPKVKSFVIKSGTASKRYIYLTPESGSGNAGYYEVLADGKFKVYKKVKKTLLEAKGYNSANLNKVIDENKKYYYLKNTKLEEFKINKKSLETILANHKSQLDTYLSANKSLKNEEDLVELFKFLNQ